MERIASETGAAIGGTLYGDALSRPGGEADTYIRMLRHDVATLKARYAEKLTKVLGDGNAAALQFAVEKATQLR
jgi:hypothetical protein